MLLFAPLGLHRLYTYTALRDMSADCIGTFRTMQARAGLQCARRPNSECTQAHAEPDGLHCALFSVPVEFVTTCTSTHTRAHAHTQAQAGAEVDLKVGAGKPIGELKFGDQNVQVVNVATGIMLDVSLAGARAMGINSYNNIIMYTHWRTRPQVQRGLQPAPSPVCTSHCALGCVSARLQVPARCCVRGSKVANMASGIMPGTIYLRVAGWCSTAPPTTTTTHTQTRTRTRTCVRVHGLPCTGTYLAVDNESNRKIYGRDVGFEEILTGAVPPPPQFKPLADMLHSLAAQAP